MNYCKTCTCEIPKLRKFCSLQCYNKNRPPFTKERCLNVSKGLMGYKHNEEFKMKARQRQLGKKRTEIAKNKTSQSLIKTHQEKEWGFIKGSTPHNKGQIGFRAGIPRHDYNEEFRRKVGIAGMGREPWNKNFSKFEDDRLLNLSNSMKINNPMYNLEIRKKVSAIIQGVSIENWKEFISFGEYDDNFSKEFKKTIKVRENYMCFLCKSKPQKLDIHHIDYNKKNTVDNNCVALCHPCHTKTNFNRNYWINYFQKTMESEIYGRINVEI